MSDLDNKLENILLEGHFCDDIPLTLEAIKQAFADAGYQPIATPVLSSEDNVNYYFDRGDKSWKVVPTHLMTGQEWYDRFTKNLPPITIDELPIIAKMFDMCNLAAKRAAEINN